jgi:hypothetical protein
MAVVVGGEHWQSRAKRAAASAAAPCPASADRALLPLCGEVKQQASKGSFFLLLNIEFEHIAGKRDLDGLFAQSESN